MFDCLGLLCTVARSRTELVRKGCAVQKETLVRLPDLGWRDLRPLFTGRSACYGGHSYGPGARPYHLVHFIVSGSGILRMKETTFHLHAHQAFIIAPNELVYYQADFDNPWTYEWIAFDGTRAVDLMSQLGFTFPMIVSNLTQSDFTDVDGQLTLMRQRNHKSAFDNLQDQSALFAILSTLAQSVRQTREPLASKDGGRAESYVDQAISLIGQKYNSDLSVEGLAAEIGIDRSYLSTIFKRQTGLTVKDYLTSFRISRSQEILFTTDCPVTQVARMSGYNSVSYFSKAFKRQMGMSPNQYRRWRRSRLARGGT